MRKLFFLCLTFNFLYANLLAQSFYNGSFEKDTVAVCTYSLDNPHFNAQMPHVTAFGNSDNGYDSNHYLKPTGRVSIQDSGCYVMPQQGNWCIGLKGLFGPTFDAISLELDTYLDSGATYYLSFYCYGNTSFQNFECDLLLGQAQNNFLFGSTIYSVTANYLTWKNSNFSFVAGDSTRFITVMAKPGYNSWIQVDNFVISKNPIPLGIKKYVTDFFKIYPNPVSDNLTIHFTTLEAENKLILYNNLGLVVLQDFVTQSFSKSLDVSALAEGLYTLRISNGNAGASKKIIIVK